jgi:hypothetical protein
MPAQAMDRGLGRYAEPTDPVLQTWLAVINSYYYGNIITLLDRGGP